ncbi:ANKRD11_12 [Lepeophtheirus salmonis]|uniref:ANKRD11_12 n=1 Tax=Lepeophtheirus salmonis TaxID=72036 RepID=A0A7R8H0R3_LEPSM|nr:ANKRD11_12 [Lepeophtheirus salmonis]CAF2794420.1 ANKRD11_12 [Lepeophtheirus salmonis]
MELDLSIDYLKIRVDKPPERGPYILLYCCLLSEALINEDALIISYCNSTKKVDCCHGHYVDEIGLSSLDWMDDEVQFLCITKSASGCPFPPKTLWYIKKCSHTFCGSCLKENADNGQCMTCKTPYVQKRDLCIRHSTREAISVYHKLKLILNPDYVTLYLEVDPMESRKENKDKRTPIGKKSSQDTNLTPNTSKSRKKSLEEGGGKSVAVNMKSSTPKGRPLKEKKILKSNINKRNVIGETPLHVACCKGDYDKVCELLGMGANPNNQDNAGWTPLHECAQKGIYYIAKVLLDKGAAPSVSWRT